MSAESSRTVVVGVVFAAGAALLQRWCADRARQRDAEELARRVTIIITTSAAESNPSTSVLESVFATFFVVPGLSRCKKIIVCDWPDLDDSHVRSCHHGRIQGKNLESYREYLNNINDLCQTGNEAWAHTTCVTLSHRHGFGLAVGAGLEHVKTEFVLVVQHDRCFVSPVPMLNVVKVMQEHPEIRYVGFPVNNQSAYRNPETITARHGGLKICPREVGGLHLLPLVMWYDSTHLASVAHYRQIVMPELKTGDFIEESFGRRQVEDIVKHGLAAHEKYGSFMLMDPAKPRGYSVAHLEILRSKGPQRHRKEEYGSAELCRLRRVLHDKSKRPSRTHAEHDRRLCQRIGLIQRLAEVGALSPSLAPSLREILSLAAACKLRIPGWRDLSIHRLGAFQHAGD